MSSSKTWPYRQLRPPVSISLSLQRVNVEFLRRFSDLEPVYVNKMKDIMTLDSSKWCKEFTDWEHMTLRTDLKHQDDFCLLSLSNWQKLITAFGGAPEVPFFKYEVESKVT